MYKKQRYFNNSESISYRNEDTIRWIFVISLVALIVMTIVHPTNMSAPLSFAIVPAIGIVTSSVVKTSEFHIRPASLLLILYVTIVYISTALSSLVIFRSDSITLLVLCFLYICATSIKLSDREIRFLIKTFIITSTIVSINVTYNWMIGNYYHEWFRRVTLTLFGVYKDPNYVSAYICPSLFFAITSKKESKKSKILYMISIILMIGAMLLMQSRGGMIMLLLGLTIYYWDRIWTLSVRSILTNVLLIVIPLLTLHYVLPILPNQVINRFTNMSSQSGRIELWKVAMGAFCQSPIIGSGLNSGSSLSLVSNAAGFHYTHNVYIDLLVAGGIIGVIVLAAFYYYDIIKLFNGNLRTEISLTVVLMLPLTFINGLITLSFFTPLIMLRILCSSLGNRNL